MEQEVWCGVCAFVGYIFVTREHSGGLLVVGFWVAFCNPRMFELCSVCERCVGYIFVTREH